MSIFTIIARAVTPMYLRFFDVLVKKVEIALEVCSRSSEFGAIARIVLRHWNTKAWPILIPVSSALFKVYFTTSNI